MLSLFFTLSGTILGQTHEQPIYENNRSTIVEIGDGNDSGSYPEFYADWGNYYKNVRTQTLYMASELNGPMLITDLQWEFFRIPTFPDKYLRHVKIRIHETTDYQLTYGNYYDTIEAATVFTADMFYPADSLGWGNIIDIEDYAYSGHNNLIIDIIWGTNDSYAQPFFQTCKTHVGPVRMLLGYGDQQNPPYMPQYQIDLNWFSNIRYYTDPLEVGDLCGTVTANGSAVWEAVVEAGNVTTTTDVDGYYSFTNLVPGETEVTCYKNGRNTIDTSVVVVPNIQTIFDIDISRPYMQLTPELLIDTLLPEEVFKDFLDIQNNGLGDLKWEAEIVYQPSGKYVVVDVEKRKKELQDQRLVSESTNFIVPNFSLADAKSDSSYPCPFGTIWSNPLYNADHAFGRKPVYQQFSDIDELFSSITVYGINNSNFTQDDSLIFLIDFFEDGTYPGELVSSCQSVAYMKETGVITDPSQYPIYYWTIDIPENSMRDGYVRVFAQTNLCSWSWLNTQDGTGNAYFYEYCIWELISPRAICIGDRSGRWLTLDDYTGSVSVDGVQTIGANLNAEGTELGEVYYADIVFSAIPEVSQVTVPVTMVIGYKVDIDEQNTESIISIYPNPVIDMVTVSSESVISKIIITNQLGQVIYSENAGARSAVLNTISYPEGTYIVKIITGSGTYTRKLIVGK